MRARKLVEIAKQKKRVRIQPGRGTSADPDSSGCEHSMLNPSLLFFVDPSIRSLLLAVLH